MHFKYQIKRNRIINITTLKKIFLLYQQNEKLLYRKTATNKIPVSSPLLEAVFFSLIEKVSLRAAEVHDLGAAVPLWNNEKRNSRETSSNIIKSMHPKPIIITSDILFNMRWSSYPSTEEREIWLHIPDTGQYRFRFSSSQANHA